MSKSKTNNNTPRKSLDVATSTGPSPDTGSRPTIVSRHQSVQDPMVTARQKNTQLKKSQTPEIADEKSDALKSLLKLSKQELAEQLADYKEHDPAPAPGETVSTKISQTKETIQTTVETELPDKFFTQIEDDSIEDETEFKSHTFRNFLIWVLVFLILGIVSVNLAIDSQMIDIGIPPVTNVI